MLVSSNSKHFIHSKVKRQHWPRAWRASQAVSAAVVENLLVQHQMWALSSVNTTVHGKHSSHDLSMVSMALWFKKNSNTVQYNKRFFSEKYKQLNIHGFSFVDAASSMSLKRRLEMYSIVKYNETQHDYRRLHFIFKLITTAPSYRESHHAASVVHRRDHTNASLWRGKKKNSFTQNSVKSVTNQGLSKTLSTGAFRRHSPIGLWKKVIW